MPEMPTRAGGGAEVAVTLPDPDLIEQRLIGMARAVAQMMRDGGLAADLGALPCMRLTMRPPDRAPYVLVCGIDAAPEARPD